MFEREISPILHNSFLEPYYHEFRVGGKFHQELYERTFEDPELTMSINKLSESVVRNYKKIVEGETTSPSIDRHSVNIFREYVNNVSPKLSKEAQEYLLRLFNQLEIISSLSRAELVKKYNIQRTK